jgi:hypothetical protein
MTKKTQALERDLNSMEQQEKQYSVNNIDLRDNLDEVNVNFTWLNNDHVALVKKYEQFEHVHEELKKNYNISQTALQNFDKERKKLYDDSVRNERIIEQKEIDIDELQKSLELETNNYDKIKIRFSEMEVEYENSEIVINTELRKYEIEKGIIQEKLDRKQIVITRLEQVKQEWTTWYEEEHQSHLYTLSQLNDQKMKTMDIK